MMISGIHQDHAETGAPPYSLNLKPRLLALAIAQVLALQAAQAGSIEVTSNSDDGADCTLREAIETVNAGVDQSNGCVINGVLGAADAISFGGGVAGSTIVTNGELTITRSVSINSGGAPITIDANGIGRVMLVGPNCTVELDQLTLTDGNAPGNSSSGGGISAFTNSTVGLTNSTVSGNSAGSGGGIYVGDGSTITLSNSTVSGNSAGNGGGIRAVYGSIVALSNSTVTGNSGGGIFTVFRSHLTLANSTVSGNYGSGISVGDCSVTLTNSMVSGNIGRGISASESSVGLTNSTVSGNTTGGDGGGIRAVSFSSVGLTNSTVSGNTAGRDGGGINTDLSSPVTLINSTVSGNSAGRNGGGIHAVGFSPVTLTNSTVSGNSTGSGSGGGIDAHEYSPVTFANSIAANSIGADCSNSNNSTATATADSIIEDGSCGTAAMAIDPVLGPLDDNGGPTRTHALLAGSPAIDNGTGAGATTTDQRGSAAVGVRDSGAYEFGAAMNALAIEKRINYRVRETFDQAAQLLVGTRYRADYKVTNNSPNRLYSVRVFEDGQLVCNLYSLMPGQSKQPSNCASNEYVLTGIKNVPANVTAKVSGSGEMLVGQGNAYYTGHSNVLGELSVTHYVNEKTADTQATAADVNDNEIEVKFRIENTGPIELYRVRLYHDPASPVNSGWQELCFKGTLMPGKVRYCKRPISVTETGLNKAFGRAQGLNANISATGFVNAINPTYFNVVLP